VVNCQRCGSDQGRNVGSHKLRESTGREAGGFDHGSQLRKKTLRWGKSETPGGCLEGCPSRGQRVREAKPENEPGEGGRGGSWTERHEVVISMTGGSVPNGPGRW